MEPRKILVCGSRDWTDGRLIEEVLAEYQGEITVIHGAARGADYLAGEAAENLGYPVQRFHADWDAHGKRAGILRNLQMLDEQPDLVLAFGKGKGTGHTVGEAARRGIPVEQYW